MVFVDVIVPVPLPNLFTYFVEEEHVSDLAVGKRVVVKFGRSKHYTAIIHKIHSTPPKESKEPTPSSTTKKSSIDAKVGSTISAAMKDSEDKEFKADVNELLSSIRPKNKGHERDPSGLKLNNLKMKPPKKNPPRPGQSNTSNRCTTLHVFDLLLPFCWVLVFVCCMLTCSDMFTLFTLVVFFSQLVLEGHHHPHHRQRCQCHHPVQPEEDSKCHRRAQQEAVGHDHHHVGHDHLGHVGHGHQRRSRSPVARRLWGQDWTHAR